MSESITIGRQRILNGDCGPLLRSLPAVSVDVIVTSPPYNIGVGYHTHNDRQPRETYLAFLSECFAEIYRVLKPHSSFFLNIGTGTKDDLTLPYEIINRVIAAGFAPQNHIIWIKAYAFDDQPAAGHDKPINSPLYLTRQHEIVLHLTKHGGVRLDKLAIFVPYADKSNLGRHNKSQADPTVPKADKRDRGNVWFVDYPTVQSSKTGKHDHPAGFPVELPTLCIKLHGVRPDLVVLDPFLGAGTTLVAAEMLGCRGIGIEIDSKYVETSVQRLRAIPAPAATAEAKPQHSRIGPSRAELIWCCAGSVQAEDAAGRPPTGEAAERGTQLHAIAEGLLRSGKTPSADTPPEVSAFVTEVQRLAAAAGAAPQIEHRLDLSTYHPELFGTLDAAVVDLDRGALTITDFKSGFHHVPADALQLRLYAGMAYLSLPAADAARIRWIDTVVVQPNGGGDPVRRVRHRVADILNTLDDYIDRAHVATDSENPPRTAGQWCRQHFCAARGDCQAFHAMTLREAQAEFRPVP
jgi:site-specific DNA-methyltransferase (adenine-specific)